MDRLNDSARAACASQCEIAAAAGRWEIFADWAVKRGSITLL
jgi:hypothetical protein